MATPSQQLNIRVDFSAHQGWFVDLDDQRIICKTLGDARRVAFLNAARRRTCELVVRDAYHRVIERRLIERAHLRPTSTERSSPANGR